MFQTRPSEEINHQVIVRQKEEAQQRYLHWEIKMKILTNVVAVQVSYHSQFWNEVSSTTDKKIAHRIQWEPDIEAERYQSKVSRFRSSIMKETLQVSYLKEDKFFNQTQYCIC